jgi:hypothetical protein
MTDWWLAFGKVQVHRFRSGQAVRLGLRPSLRTTNFWFARLSLTAAHEWGTRHGE